ncbi:MULTISPECIES: hypothetical protein [Cyanophyceae]|uniref:Uncharacterized protein n=1 Tax=Leptolyngbya subtilissima DQ-A4 TaxID=2933933 RepID=A0ABV0JZJ6_9CYAN|nr:hypothetical protein [Nodosilinea sp. FACHB-141]MBD2112570.1 hypothetical protein [Nodosilinea sp. FACHB-141]
MGKAIALQGTVVAVPGAMPYSPAQTGAWTALPVQVKAYPKLKVGGQSVIYEAECKFMFTGVQTPPSGPPVPVTGQETVKLTAKSTKLQKKVLVQGDMMQSSYGNQLKIVTTSKVKTA